MSNLIKGPYQVKADNITIPHVSDFVYIDKKLTIDILITDYELANKFLDKLKVKTIRFIGTGDNNPGARFEVKNQSVSMFAQDYSVLVLQLKYDVTSAVVGATN